MIVKRGSVLAMSCLVVQLCVNFLQVVLIKIQLLKTQ